jgi:hypothetical protein
LSVSFKKSNLKFHAETKQVSSNWPQNTDVTYVSELVDTHNAFDKSSGTFTAPFDGKYGFIFNSLFYHDGQLYAYHNGNKLTVLHRFSSANTDESSSIYFALYLQKNDRVKINSGTAEIWLDFFPAKFMGFLLQ